MAIIKNLRYYDKSRNIPRSKSYVSSKLISFGLIPDELLGFKKKFQAKEMSRLINCFL